MKTSAAVAVCLCLFAVCDTASGADAKGRTRGKPASPPARAQQPSPTELDTLRTKFWALSARVHALGARATEDQKELLAQADDLLSRWDAADRLQEIASALNILDAASLDPCEGPKASLILAQEMGQTTQVYRSYKDIDQLQCHDPALNAAAKAYLRTHEERTPAPAPSPAPSADTASVPAATQPAAPSRPAKRAPAPPPVAAQKPAVAAPPAASLTLDVWQSAWGDFATLPALSDYARRNSITAVNLNPGHGVTEATMSKSHAQLRDLVRRLRQGGIEQINYLYAELAYPIANYATLLTRHPDLGITTIVDDSEFTDDKKHRFEENARVVKAARLRYSAFITLEGAGNSGVSDATRYWAIDRIDEPIFMSYFGCSLEEQREALRDLFEYADQQGKVANVRIAILLGGKKVGRERSCEQELGPSGFPAFLAGLHSWAQGYRSYGGIVLETNLRLPLFDVVAAGSSLDRRPGRVQ